jgi:hypothetical protein
LGKFSEFIGGKMLISFGFSVYGLIYSRKILFPRKENNQVEIASAVNIEVVAQVVELEEFEQNERKNDADLERRDSFDISERGFAIADAEFPKRLTRKSSANQNTLNFSRKVSMRSRANSMPASFESESNKSTGFVDTLSEADHRPKILRRFISADMKFHKLSEQADILEEENSWNS